MNVEAVQMAIIFLFLFGITACLVLAAQAGNIKFSLQTVFLVLTTSCVGLAMIAAFGSQVGGIVFFALFVTLPLANLVVIAALIVTAINSVGRNQAITIGYLTPLIALAFVTCGAFTYRLPEMEPIRHLMYYATGYITAWIAGSVCERTYLSMTNDRHPLKGAYREGLRSAADSQANAVNSDRALGPKETKHQTDPLDESEPNIYEIT